MEIFIGIDDTDNKESIGTGRLSRMLAKELTEKGLISHASVTRHQLLVHPDIPYTSHNSSACIEAIATGSEITEIGECAKNFLIENFHEDANPGLCIADKNTIFAEERKNYIFAFQAVGYRAQKEVINLADIKELAKSLCTRKSCTPFIWWYGDTGQGCIGAISGVGLRSTGNDGRFIALEGIREIRGVMTVGEILRHTQIQSVMSISGVILGNDEIIETYDWIRPSLRNGKAVLIVEKGAESWRTIDKKKRRKNKKS